MLAIVLSFAGRRELGDENCAESGARKPKHSARSIKSESRGRDEAGCDSCEALGSTPP
jgi:hypothetical protein